MVMQNIVSISLLAILSVFVLTGCKPSDAKLVSLCEDQIKDALRSPSGYKRIDVKSFSDNLTVEQYAAHQKKHGLETTPFELELIEKSGKPPVRFTAYVEYDAPNAFGTPVRGTEVCEYVSSDGTLKWLSEVNILVGGKTKTERLTDQLQAIIDNNKRRR